MQFLFFVLFFPLRDTLYSFRFVSFRRTFCFVLTWVYTAGCKAGWDSDLYVWSSQVVKNYLAYFLT